MGDPVARRRGRPRGHDPAAERVVAFRLTEEDYVRLRAAATEGGHQTVGAFCRDVIGDAVADETQDGVPV